MTLADCDQDPLMTKNEQFELSLKEGSIIKEIKKMKKPKRSSVAGLLETLLKNL